jgi:hypothetical protein
MALQNLDLIHPHQKNSAVPTGLTFHAPTRRQTPFKMHLNRTKSQLRLDALARGKHRALFDHPAR